MVFTGQRGMDDDAGRNVDDQSKGREVLHRIVGELAHERRIDHEAAGDYPRRVAVGRALRDDFGADHAAGAGAVIEDEVMAEHLGHLRREQTEKDIAVAARARRG
jgi:hypothetical protein